MRRPLSASDMDIPAALQGIKMELIGEERRQEFM
jgi:hypothetical protein